MKFKPQPWQLILLIAVVCGVTIGGIVWYHSTTLTPAALLKRIPSSDGVVLWMDFAAMRRAGFLQLLAGARQTEDAEYQSFVYATRFDYMNDLDSVLALFPRTGGFYGIISGRFDWKTLRAYVTREHGECVNSLCRLRGSQPDRHISFLPMRTDLMAMAVSATDSYAANDLTTPRPGPELPMPQGFLWLRFPGALPKSSAGLPDGLGPFARIVENASSVTVAFVPDGNRLAAQLDVTCRTGQEAADVASQLSEVTDRARKAFVLEHQTPNPADFSSIVVSGTFRTEGVHAFGKWPIERQFVQTQLGTR